MTKLTKKSATSPANIAFIKFWGKKNPKLNIPYNNSFSMNLDSCLTTTTVHFMDNLKEDEVVIDCKKVEGEARDRVVRILDIVRTWAKVKAKAKMSSINNFPSDAGVASSASAFSALALAASSSAGLKLSKKKLSILARLGSGSASRSVVDGFSEWKKGTTNNDSFAVQIAKPSYWDLRDIVTLVSSEKKEKSSTEGHSVATTSPYFEKRQKDLPARSNNLKKAFLKKDIDTFGKLLEEEAMDLHIMAMTSKPPIFYLNSATFAVMQALRELRIKGTKGYFTMDAGPNVHIICRKKDVEVINRTIKRVSGVKSTIINKAGVGSRLTNNHLF
ncbi:MAG: diphosphomevalonate decarboxylase [Patescibacteria group bacterium]